jgi:hypothetical protein
MTTSSSSKHKQKSKTKLKANVKKEGDNLKNNETENGDSKNKNDAETNDSSTPMVSVENNVAKVSAEELKTEEKQEIVKVEPIDNTNEGDEKNENDHESVDGDEEGDGDDDEGEDEDEEEKVENEEINESNPDHEEKKSNTKNKKSSKATGGGDYVNPRGVRFIQDTNASSSSSTGASTNAANTPYGLPCVRELLRFLISLINTKNSDLMISMGLNLITIGLESGIDYISSYQSLLAYVKDDLLKNLYQLLSTERMAQYASVLRVSFLLFESLRTHLKLQMEHFLNKLMDICLISSPNDSYFAVNSLNGEIGLGGSNSSASLQQQPTSNSSNKSNASNLNKQITQEQKEMTIDYFLQMLRIPGFAVEIYLNYDCSLNCSNLFENLTKLLSKVIYFR